VSHCIFGPLAPWNTQLPFLLTWYRARVSILSPSPSSSSISCRCATRRWCTAPACPRPARRPLPLVPVRHPAAPRLLSVRRPDQRPCLHSWRPCPRSVCLCPRSGYPCPRSKRLRRPNSRLRLPELVPCCFFSLKK
jgi:hypothetical protein